MTNAEKDFMAKLPESIQQWSAQQLIMQWGVEKRMVFGKVITWLQHVLYKPEAQQLTLQDLQQISELINNINNQKPDSDAITKNQ